MRARIDFLITAWLTVLVLGVIVFCQQREIQSLRGMVASDSMVINGFQYAQDRLRAGLDSCRRDFYDLAKMTDRLAMKRKAK